MAGKAELFIRLMLEDKATGELKKAGDSVKVLGTSYKVAAAAVTGAAASIGGALADMAREGAADAARMEAVRVATVNAGGAWEEAGPQLNAFITRMRDTRSVADDQLAPSLAALIAVTGDYGKAMDLAALASDLARGKNMDLATASELVGKVAEGNVSILTRYGITLEKGATSQEALAELQRRFAGQAEAYAGTTKGQLEILTMKFGDFREEIGNALGAAQPFFMLLPGLSAGMTALSTAAGWVAAGHARATIAMIASKVASMAGAVATGAMAAAQWLLNAALTANPIGIVVVALAALAAGLVYAYQNSEDFRRIVDSVFSWLKGAATTAIAVAGGALNAFGETIAVIIKAITDLIWWLGQLPANVIGGIGGLANQILGVPGAAAGGIVMRPTLAMVGEAGPEAIVPLRGGNVPGGITVNVYVAGSVTAEQDLAETIRRQLLLTKTRNYSTGLA